MSQSSKSNAPFAQRCFSELCRIRWRRSDTQSVWAGVYIVGITENIRNSCNWLHCLTVSAGENMAVLFLIALNVLNVNSFLVPLHWPTLIDHMIWPKSFFCLSIQCKSGLFIGFFIGILLYFSSKYVESGGSASLCWGQSRLPATQRGHPVVHADVHIYI